ncbi:MAG TPA: hypothetical protein PLD10_18955, partial [Rhodopila sp.]|nr:hypothetical protein [Rhodopila sp.]
ALIPVPRTGFAALKASLPTLAPKFAFLDGIGTNPNRAEYVAWLKRSASHGDSEAMYLLSAAYRDGALVAPDQAAAWRYLSDAAANGHALAQARVGIAYAAGELGQAQNGDLAKHWLTAVTDAAERDPDPILPRSPDASILALARYHLALLVQPADASRAAGLLQQASDQGCAAATNQLALAYHRGLGVARDDVKAVAMFQRAADAGNGEAAFWLATGYQDGWAGPQSQATAVGWFRRAAALGYPKAWAALGEAYETAQGVAFDAAEAMTWYQLAGNNGVVSAQLRLGDIARRGELGQARNESVALRWYQLAAAKADPLAEERIGDLYWDGSLGVPRDRTRAVKHYRAAAARGVAGAERKLAVAYADADGAPADDAKLMFWLRKAAESGDRQAARMLGQAILINIDNSYDPVEAALWLAVAADGDRPTPPRAAVVSDAVGTHLHLTPPEYKALEVRLVRWQAKDVGE